MSLRIVIILCMANHVLAVCDGDQSCTTASVQTLVLMQRHGNEPEARDVSKDLPDEVQTLVLTQRRDDPDVSQGLPDDGGIEFQQVSDPVDLDSKFQWSAINGLRNEVARLKEQMKASFEAGHYVFGGVCEKGALVDEAERTMDDQCGSCDNGYDLTDDSPPTCKPYRICKCTGLWSNQFKCLAGPGLKAPISCGNEELCVGGGGSRGYRILTSLEEPRELCRSVACQCTDHGGFNCADNRTGGACASGTVCVGSGVQILKSLAEPRELCKVACQCTGHGNQFKCSDDTTAYCASGQECYRRSDEWWTKGAYDEACK